MVTTNEEVRPVHDWPIRIGGLMRCCIETLHLDVTYVSDGHIVPCAYCSSSMRLSNGAFEWVRP